MKKQTKIGLIALGLLVVIGLSAFTVATQVNAQGGIDKGNLRIGIDNDDHKQALADELGISLEDLQAAFTSAQTAILQDKVAAGEITQDKADKILEDLDDTDRPFRMMGKGPVQSETFDTYLAEALGISVDQLTEARNNVFQAEIAQAVADGKITQEQADLMIARRSVQGYIADAQTTAYKNAIAQAVIDGKITQAQADLLLANIGEGRAMGFGGGMGFSGGRCGGKR
jgi:polyhydroxyalkanoate synthesis regulator phasin